MKLLKISSSLVLLVVFAACAHHNDSPAPGAQNTDPTVLIDTNERENWTDCSGKVIVDKIVRTAAVHSIKMNPKKNIPIDSSSFFNVDMDNAEFTPRLDIFKGPGGDNYKYVNFCQGPKANGCDMVVKDGDNRIEYKYWSYKTAPCKDDPASSCQTDVLEESDVRPIHFTVLTVMSDKVCKRSPSACPLTSASSWGNCVY
jgi:hypothetical protein